MKLFQKISTALVLVFLAMACANKEKQNEIDKLQKELLAMHDEVMPKSMGLPDLRKKIIDKAHSNSKIETETKTISDSLQIVDDKMTTWMQDLGTAMNDTKDNAVKLKMYQKLNTEIKTIKTETDQTINKAQGILK